MLQLSITVSSTFSRSPRCVAGTRRGDLRPGSVGVGLGLRERFAAAAGDSVDVGLDIDGLDDFADIQDHPGILLQGSGRDAAGAPEGTPLQPDGTLDRDESSLPRSCGFAPASSETFTSWSVPAWVHRSYHVNRLPTTAPLRRASKMRLSFASTSAHAVARSRPNAAKPPPTDMIR